MLGDGLGSLMSLVRCRLEEEEGTGRTSDLGGRGAKVRVVTPLRGEGLTVRTTGTARRGLKSREVEGGTTGLEECTSELVGGASSLATGEGGTELDTRMCRGATPCTSVVEVEGSGGAHKGRNVFDLSASSAARRGRRSTVNAANSALIAASSCRVSARSDSSWVTVVKRFASAVGSGALVVFSATLGAGGDDGRGNVW